MSDTFPISDSLLWKALPDLTLNIAQTASLCGISVRQLGYWTRQGYVSSQGRGARRTYGLDAVRRVLAIRKAMENGASLRQALRQVASSDSVLPESSAPPSAVSISLSSSLSPEEVDRLVLSLRTLFETNRQTRDNAAGLAVKLGRTEEDVLAVAERLCLAGLLVKNTRQGMAIFRQAEREAAHE